MSDPFEESALRYHREPTPGKLAITPTKPLANQFDLAQAYSPGVAYPCLRISENPADAALYTSRGNLVAVISNGTAVLVLHAGERALVPLGFRARLPVGIEAQVRPRSGTSLKTDIVIANAPGTIDADYPDEWCVPVRHGGTRDLVITHGERIAQMILARHEVLEFRAGEVTATTDRNGGFGSTGR